MKISTWFTKKQSQAYKNAKKEMLTAFEKDIEAANLMRHPILDSFILKSTISNTSDRLKTERKLQEINFLSPSDYDKILDAVVHEVTRRFIKR